MIQQYELLGEVKTIPQWLGLFPLLWEYNFDAKFSLFKKVIESNKQEDSKSEQDTETIKRLMDEIEYWKKELHFIKKYPPQEQLQNSFVWTDELVINFIHFTVTSDNPQTYLGRCADIVDFKEANHTI